MSYSFDGSGDYMTGTLTTTRTFPFTLACFIKVTAHPLANQVLINFGTTIGTVTDSIDLRIGVTVDQYGARYTDAVPNASTALEEENIDGVWAGIVGTFLNDDTRTVYVNTLGQFDIDNTARGTSGGLWNDIRIGRTLAGGGDYAGLMAEIAMWSGVLADADITDYMSGIAASELDAANLVGYWPLSSSGSNQSNIGVDAGGDLTVTSATFNADHPTITTGETGITAKARFYSMLRTGSSS